MKPSNSSLWIIVASFVLLAGEVPAQSASLNAPSAIYKGDTISYAITLDAITDRNTSITLIIAEESNNDLVPDELEGIRTVVVSAGSTRLALSIPTRNTAPGDRTVSSRADLSIGEPTGGANYSFGETTAVSVVIVDRNCGYAVDVDADDDGLIEICDLEDLDAIRYTPDGSGYRASRTAPLFNRGCAEDAEGNDGVCRGYELTRNLNFGDAGSYFASRINRQWSEGLGWQPIGTGANPFSGYFEARGFTITNLYINRPADNVGFFAYTASTAQINGLTLLRSNITGRSQVAGLVAVNQGIVSNINVVRGSVVGSVGTVGGLVAVNRGTVVNNNILLERVAGGVFESRCRNNRATSNCEAAERIATVIRDGNTVGGLIGDNFGTVSDNFVSTDVLGGERVGGLVGFNSGRILGGNDIRGNIRGNGYGGGLVGYTIGSIVGNNAGADVLVADDYAGGLIGYACSSIIGSRRCPSLQGIVPPDNLQTFRLADNSASGAVAGGNYIGGLVGYSDNTITDSTTKDIEVSGNTHVGGLVGFYAGERLADCSATEIRIDGNDNVGGLIGTLDKTGSVIVGSFTSGLVGGSTDVGGLIGMNNEGTINNSYAITNVAGSSNVGGLIGSAENSRIENSYASGDVRGTGFSVGGLVGYSFGGSITFSYATGSVVGDNSDDPGIDNDVNNVGGLVGRADNGMIRSSYAVNPQVSGADRIGGLVGRKFGGTVELCYALSSVAGTNRVGGLVGENSAAVRTAYAAGRVVGSGNAIGGLVGINSGRVLRSYWDTTEAGITTSNGGSGIADLKAAVVPGESPSDAFYLWSRNDWDFGSTTEYPILKDADGTVLASQVIRIATLAVNGGFTLVPEFDPEINNYYVVVGDNPTAISLDVAARDSDVAFSVLKVGDEANAITVTGSDNDLSIDLNAMPAATELIVARNYSVQILRNLAASVTVDPSNRRVREGQTLRFNVASNTDEIVPLSYTWKQTMPLLPLLMDGLDIGITVNSPDFDLTIPGDFVILPTETELGATLSVELSDGRFGNRGVDSEQFVVVKTDNGSPVLAALTFVDGTSLLHSPGFEAVIAADADGIAPIAEQNRLYQWQFRETGEADSWISIDDATDATFDVGTHELGNVRYRLQIYYIDGQGYDNTLTSQTPTAIVDKDRDGLIEIYDLEALNAIRYELSGSGYRVSETAREVSGGCPDSGCFGYELMRDLDFEDDDSYRNRRLNRALWTVSTPTDVGWIAIGNRNTPFTGTFEGNRNTLYNLQMNSAAAGDKGLFSANSGVIRNLRIAGLEIAGSSSLSRRLSGLTVINNGAVVNCHVQGEITADGTASNLIGGLVGENLGGEIINSGAFMDIVRSSNVASGLSASAILVGRMSQNGLIINSYATGRITSGMPHVAGLVGHVQASRIINSYAVADVTTNNSNNDAGTLVGSLENRSQVVNSYAQGSLSNPSNIGASVGGLVGLQRQDSSVRNSYATVRVVRHALPTTFPLGGLIGRLVAPSTVDASYWDTIAGDVSTSAAGSGKTTAELQTGSAQYSNTDGVYFGWDPDDWDFGTNIQYPVLKHAPNPDLAGQPACNTSDTPECGTLISPELRRGLRSLTAVNGTLSPPFTGGSYLGNIQVSASVSEIRLIAATFEDNADINIYDANGTLLQSGLASGEPSMALTLTAGEPMRHLIIEVKRVQTVRQSVILNRVVVPGVVETRECSELSNFTPINTLEDLNKIRNDLNGRYCLLRNLDFGNNASYEDAATNRPLWWTRLENFGGKTNFGWQPIGNDSNRFSGTFDGNGFVISNLQINRNAGNQSLFGSITGTVRNLGLSNVLIDAGSGNYSGALASANRGTIIGSYATGKIDGGDNIGGLVGAHLASGWIINSYAGVDVTGNTAVGGLVGVAEGTPNLIINSYATGSISAAGLSGGFIGVQRRGEIRNSFATGNVEGSTTGNNRAIGGFVGEKLNNTVIRNSYASGSVTGRNQVGGFIGNLMQSGTNGLIANSYSIGSVSGTGSNIGGFLGNSNTNGRVQNSYWNTQTSGRSNSARGSGLNTQQMQLPTAPNRTSPARYTNWSTDNWDFGTDAQYPRLKYAPNPDSSGRRTCSDAGGDGLPVCGSLIAPRLRYDLNELSVFPGRFSPRLNFDGRAERLPNACYRCRCRQHDPIDCRVAGYRCAVSCLAWRG